MDMIEGGSDLGVRSLGVVQVLSAAHRLVDGVHLVRVPRVHLLERRLVS